MSGIPEEVDVLVVGYGPVGAAIAALLGRHGLRTLVIDRAPEIFTAPRAIALDNEALRILQMVGVRDDEFAKIPIPYVRMLCPYLGEFGRVNTSGTIDDHPKLVTFHQPELERVLRRHAESHATVTARTGVELVRFEDSGTAVLAVVRGADGPETTVRAQYLVGADGASSSIRAGLGQQLGGRTFPEDWLIVDALDVPGGLDHVEFLCDPARPTPHMIAPGGRTRWEFMLRPGETREEMESDVAIAALLAPWVDARTVRIERRAVYRFHARCCERFSVGRVFLAGDAAHLTPPFVGQGLVAGLRDAANLCWKLAWVLRGRAQPSILDSYDTERRPHAKRMIDLARLMGQMVMPRSRPRALAVHGAMALARHLPFARPYLDELGIKPENAFPEGLFARGRGDVRRGAWLPQALLRTASGATLRSDDVLGISLALVVSGAVAPRLSAETRRRWAAAGGSVTRMEAPGRTDAHSDAHEDLGGVIAPKLLKAGWCVAVRPDRTVLHDGPVADAERVVRESLSLLKGGQTARTAAVGQDLG